jgi:ApaG protein
MDHGDQMRAMTQSNEYQIQVAVDTAYLHGQSDPSRDRFVFSYTITISNTGAMPARLLKRHWVITDANGKVQEVHGDGVVGEYPYLKPGQSYRYTSGTILETPVGSMEGEYRMEAEDGEHFQAPIPAFTLAVPGVIN